MAQYLKRLLGGGGGGAQAVPLSDEEDDEERVVIEQRDASELQASSDGEHDDESLKGPWQRRYWTELKSQVALAGPVIAGYLLQMSLNLVRSFPFFFSVFSTFVQVVVISVGQSNTAKELGAVSLATMYVNVTGLSIVFGLASAIDTLCSQEFGRDPNSKMVGIVRFRFSLFDRLLTIGVSIFNEGSLFFLPAFFRSRSYGV